MKRVVLVVSNDITIDQRLHKVCTSLINNGYDPLLVGRSKKDSAPLVQRAYRTKRLPMFFEQGKFFYVELNLSLFFFLLFAKVDIITANDLDTLVPCYLVAKLRFKRLVYDSHEYYTELPELVHRPFEKRVWTIIERILFPRLQFVSTVGKMIAKEYQEKYKVYVAVIRNMPFKKGENTAEGLRDKILIYQGAVNIGRGFELMIDTMKLLPEFQLWIVGEGPSLETVKERSKDFPNIKLWGKKAFDQLHEITRRALIGLSLEEDMGLNYRYALPNKLFDYVNASVPVISSDLPEMAALVREYEIGKVLEERTPEALASCVRELTLNATEYKRLVLNCKKASEELVWERQEAILLSLYKI